jgi:hypothetical protein
MEWWQILVLVAFAASLFWTLVVAVAAKTRRFELRLLMISAALAGAAVVVPVVSWCYYVYHDDEAIVTVINQSGLDVFVRSGCCWGYASDSGKLAPRDIKHFRETSDAPAVAEIGFVEIVYGPNSGGYILIEGALGDEGIIVTVEPVRDIE